MTPEELFDDAYSLYKEALKELEEGRIRDAAEKAWGATLRATQALILAKTGEPPQRSDITSQQLCKLALTDPQMEEKILGRYYTRLHTLHGDCFYLGICEPIEDIKKRIIQTKEFIEDVQGLVGGKR